MALTVKDAAAVDRDLKTTVVADEHIGHSIPTDSSGAEIVIATAAKQDTGNTALAAIKTAVETLDNAIAGSEMQVDIVGSLPAGSANIGDVDVASIAAGDNNIGNVDVVTLPALPAGTNNIGDVDVLTVIPGTGATNLGKAIDSVVGATDTGVAPLALRDDALSSLTPAEGDYAPLRVDANGGLWVTPSGTVTVAAHAVTNAGVFVVQENGAALTALQLIDNAVSGAGFNITQFGGASVPIGAGTEATAVRVTLPTNGTGIVGLAAGANNIGDVDVLSVVPGTGATALGKAIDTAAGATDTGVAALAVRDDALSTLTPAETDYAPLRVDSTGALWVVASGTITVASHAVTNAGVFVVQENGAALTALQVIDNPVIVDDAAFTPAATSVMMAGFEYDDSSPDSVNEGDGGAARMSANRNIYTTIRDAAGNERGLNVDASGRIAVDAALIGGAAAPIGAGTEATALRVTLPTNGTGIVGLAAGTNGIGKLTANSGVDIGDVDVTTVIPGTGATQLGKAIDSVPGATDTGVAALVVRDDALSTLTPADADYTTLRVDSLGALWSRPTAPATGTQSIVADTASSTTILASNAARRGASVYNDSSAILYLLVGTGTASATVYTCRVYQFGYYEVPAGYTGIISGIWATDPGDGAARVTEWT
jgi:hypothetical protein